jgi:hypothetical protein
MPRLLSWQNLMPRLLSWLTISLSTKFSGRQHSKFGHTPSNCHKTKPILTTSHPRYFATQKSYPNNLEGKNLPWPRLLMQACLPLRIICMIDCCPLSKINHLASTRTCTSWSMNVVSIILPIPPHQKFKPRLISHHPLATHIHSRNRSHPNHLVLRPISNHPLKILHTFKIRSHPFSYILIPSSPPIPTTQASSDLAPSTGNTQPFQEQEPPESPCAASNLEPSIDNTAHNQDQEPSFKLQQ